MSSLTWVDPDGTETAISADGVPAGLVGRGMPPVRPFVGTMPNRAGAVYSGTTHDVRRVSVPFEVWGTDVDGADVRAALRAWALRLATLTGPGRLRCTSELGDERELVAWYVGGLELTETGLGIYQQATLEFDAPDPYWSDVSDSTAEAAGGSAVGPKWFPFFPLVLGGSSIAAELTIDNTGDLETWPVLSITGPADGPTLRNITTGQALTLDATVGAGEVVTLDARPGARTVTRHDGLDMYADLTLRQWWPLARGQNRVRLEASLTTADSVLAVRWRRRWLTV